MHGGATIGIPRGGRVGGTPILLLIALLLAACGGVPRAYPGPARDESEVARLRAQRGRIVELDDVERFASELEILPGAHDVVVRFVLQGDEIAPNVRDEDVIRVVCRCQTTLLAGGRYRLALDAPAPVSQGSIVTRYARRVSLIDEIDDRRLFLAFDCEDG